jgi:hypothetical protein
MKDGLIGVVVFVSLSESPAWVFGLLFLSFFVPCPKFLPGALGQKRFVKAAKTGFCWWARHPPATLSK